MLVAYPGLRTGSINVSGTSSILGNDVYARFLLCRDCIHRVDFITGWNDTRVADEVAIRSRSTLTAASGNLPIGTVLTTFDQFTAHNSFNGGILGLQWQRNCGCWSTQLLTRVSLGDMHETVSANGDCASTGTPITNPTAGARSLGPATSARHRRRVHRDLGRIGL